ncbi:hypothetical protein NHX12_013545, partial [Muraenolepis orangiensis]
MEPGDLFIPLESIDEEATLTCDAKGIPAPEWSLNGTLINLSLDRRRRLSGGNLIISSLDRSEDVGQYQCTAYNTAGAVLSRRASLQFAFLDHFKVHTRSGVSVREGQGVVLLCGTPTSSGDLTYAWVFNEYPYFVQQDNRRFVSQKTGNLYIAKVESSDVGNYTCVVMNSVTKGKVQSSPTSLILRSGDVMGEYEPKIEVHFPENVPAAKGSTVSLECFALGNKVKMKYSNAVLEIPSFQQDDTGGYECLAENRMGKNTAAGRLAFYGKHPAEPRGSLLLLYYLLLVLSSPSPWGLFTLSSPSPHLLLVLSSPSPHPLLTLSSPPPHPLLTLSLPFSHVLLMFSSPSPPILLKFSSPSPKPQWVQTMKDTALAIEERLQWDCRANGKPKPSYTWLKNGQPLDAECVAENKHGVVYFGAELMVLASPPDFTGNLLRALLKAKAGSTVTLDCKPQAYPLASILWKKGTVPIHTNDRITLSAEGVLRLANVTRSDAGSYTCYARNRFGMSSTTGRLLVTDPTRITQGPMDTEITVGKSVVLPCQVASDPVLDVSFSWAFNGQLVAKGDSHFELVGGRSAGDLMIRNVDLNHAGKYICVVDTDVESLSAVAVLVVK